jgi:hypothetical protein
MKSSSSGQKVSTLTKLKEAAKLLHTARRRSALSADRLFGKYDSNIREYGELFKKHTGRDIKSAKIVEVGFGARPYRLATFHAKQLNAIGIDLDMPVLDGSFREFLRVVRNNGFERALKSITRHYAADRIEREKFKTYHHQTGEFLKRENLIIGSASNPEIWERLRVVDLVTSEDVVEHIPADDLKTLVRLIAEHLADDGLALICPNVFTGITGGHLLEWYHDVVDEPGKVSDPWEHLRRNRVPVNTYLNHLTRADFRALFSEYFEILEEIVREPDLGRQWYTQEVQQDLSDWPEEELFSNQVIFVMRKRSPAPA